MAIFYYYDQLGRRQGPINSAQLKALADHGVITPDTMMESETGHRGKASQLPNLFPSGPTGEPGGVSSDSGSSYAEAGASLQTGANSGYNSPVQRMADHWPGGLEAWLRNFSFTDLRLPAVNLILSRWLYIFCYIVFHVILILAAIALCVVPILNLREGIQVLLIPIIGIPLLILYRYIGLIGLRLGFEVYILIWDWIISTTRAAQKRL